MQKQVLYTIFIVQISRTSYLIHTMWNISFKSGCKITICMCYYAAHSSFFFITQKTQSITINLCLRFWKTHSIRMTMLPAPICITSLRRVYEYTYTTSIHWNILFRVTQKFTRFQLTETSVNKRLKICLLPYPEWDTPTGAGLQLQR